MTNEMLGTDPHVAERVLFVDIDHPEIGRTHVMRAPWRFSDLDVAMRPGPLMGQHNDEILTQILGFSTDDCDSLKGVLQ